MGSGLEKPTSKSERNTGIRRAAVKAQSLLQVRGTEPRGRLLLSGWKALWGAPSKPQEPPPQPSPVGANRLLFLLSCQILINE